MGQFNDKIEAEFSPPKKWELSRALSYKSKDIDCKSLNAVKVATPAHKITVKKGFVTDLASTPRILWNLISPWDVARAAIIHDLLYKRIRQYRMECTTKQKTISNKIIEYENPEIIKNAKKAADKVFLMAMKDAAPSVPKWKIYSAYYAVSLFGRWSLIPNKENT